MPPPAPSSSATRASARRQHRVPSPGFPLLPSLCSITSRRPLARIPGVQLARPPAACRIPGHRARSVPSRRSAPAYHCRVSCVNARRQLTPTTVPSSLSSPLFSAYSLSRPRFSAAMAALGACAAIECLQRLHSSPAPWLPPPPWPINGPLCSPLPPHAAPSFGKSTRQSHPRFHFRPPPPPLPIRRSGHLLAPPTPSP